MAKTPGRSKQNDQKSSRGAATEPRKRTVVSGEAQKPKVLIADDDIPFRDSLAALFENEGFGVKCVGNVEDIYGLVSRYRFDVIVVDMQIPMRQTNRVEPVGGLTAVPEILRRYGEFDEDTIIVVFTGYPSVQDCFAVADAGAYYLPKCVFDVNRNLRDMSSELVQECKHLIEKRAEKKTSRLWLEGHYEDLMNRFPGQAVAILEKDLDTGGVKTTAVGEYKVVSAPTVERLKDMILRTPALRRAMPLILDIGKVDL